jgi:hypothetical protein
VESAGLTCRRTNLGRPSLASLEEVTKCLDNVEDGNYAVHTSMNTLKI